MGNLSQLFGNTGFKPAEVEEVSGDFSPLPKGLYAVTITESEIKPTSNGNGTLLTLKLVVDEGKYRNRILFDNLCVQHTNLTAQGIAQTRLKQICEAVSVKKLQDTSQIHDKALMVNLDVEFDKFQSDKTGQQAFRNSFKGYQPLNKEVVTSNDDDDFDDAPF